MEQADRAAGKPHPLRVAGGWPADRNEWPWIGKSNFLDSSKLPH